MKKIAHLLMGRLTIVGVSILLQICWLFLVLWKFSYQFTYANLIIPRCGDCSGACDCEQVGESGE